MIFDCIELEEVERCLRLYESVWESCRIFKDIGDYQSVVRVIKTKLSIEFDESHRIRSVQERGREGKKKKGRDWIH
jgi:hypothetical protein